MNAAAWTPPTEGRITELSPSLTLADAVPRSDHGGQQSRVAQRLHHRQPRLVQLRVSQLLARQANRRQRLRAGHDGRSDRRARIGGETPIPSLEIGTDLIAQVGNCDNGYACAYQNNLSWSSPTTPLPTEADPRVVFERLFGDGGSPERRRAELQKSGSILDWMTSDLARLRRELGAGDRVRVGQYLDSVREVERRIQRAEQSDAATLPDLDRPASVPAVWEDHVRLMFDLQVLALQADVTRVITFQLARETSTRTYPHIGVPEPHHPVSHHTNDPEKLVKLARSTRITCRCSPTWSRSCRRRRTATARCSITRSTCWAAAWAIRTSTITRICRSSSPEDAAAAQGRPSHQVREADSAGESPPVAARQGRRASRQVCRQQRKSERSRAAEPFRARHDDCRSPFTHDVAAASQRPASGSC